jgi:hypothetical protein
LTGDVTVAQGSAIFICLEAPEHKTMELHLLAQDVVGGRWVQGPGRNQRAFNSAQYALASGERKTFETHRESARLDAK